MSSDPLPPEEQFFADMVLYLLGQIFDALSALVDALPTALRTRWFWLLQSLVVAGAATAGWILARRASSRLSSTPPHSPDILPTSYGGSSSAHLQSWETSTSRLLHAHAPHSYSYESISQRTISNASLTGPPSRARSTASVQAVTQVRRTNVSEGTTTPDGCQSSPAPLRKQPSVPPVLAFTPPPPPPPPLVQKPSYSPPVPVQPPYSPVVPQIQPAYTNPEPFLGIKPKERRCESCNPPADKVSLVEQGKWLREQADSLSKKALQMIFDGHNPNLVIRNGMRIDLHNQYKNSAADCARKYVKLAREQNLTTVSFIVGRGNHSKNKKSIIGPHVTKALKELGLKVHSPVHNPGEVVVTL